MKGGDSLVSRMKKTDKVAPDWIKELEYTQCLERDVELHRVFYENSPLYLLHISGSAWFMVDDLADHFHLRDEDILDVISKLPEIEKTIRHFKHSSGNAFEVLLISEVGVCAFLEKSHTLATQKFYNFLCSIIHQFHMPLDGPAGRIQHMFDKARRNRREFISRETQMLSRPKPIIGRPELFRPTLLHENLLPSSVFVVAESTPLRAYLDDSNRVWFKSEEVLKAMNYGSIAEPTSVFRELPCCWLADLETQDESGESRKESYILSNGLLVFLAASTDIRSVYLMYYLILQLTLLWDHNKGTDNEEAVHTEVIEAIEDTREKYPYKVQFTIDQDGTVWYSAPDLLRVFRYSEKYFPASRAEQVFSNVPDIFKKTFLLEMGSGNKPTLCISEQGFWFFMGKADRPENKSAMYWYRHIAAPTIKHSKTIGISWPQFLSKPVPPLTDQLQAILQLDGLFKRFKPSPQWRKVLDIVFQQATGISPIEVYNHWKDNVEREARQIKKEKALLRERYKFKERLYSGR